MYQIYTIIYQPGLLRKIYNDIVENKFYIKNVEIKCKEINSHKRCIYFTINCNTKEFEMIYDNILNLIQIIDDDCHIESRNINMNIHEYFDPIKVHTTIVNSKTQMKFQDFINKEIPRDVILPDILSCVSQIELLPFEEQISENLLLRTITYEYPIEILEYLLKHNIYTPEIKKKVFDTCLQYNNKEQMHIFMMYGYKPDIEDVYKYAKYGASLDEFIDLLEIAT